MASGPQVHEGRVLPSVSVRALSVVGFCITEHNSNAVSVAADLGNDMESVLVFWSLDGLIGLVNNAMSV